MDDRTLIGRENRRMSCTLVVQSVEKKEDTLARWAEILAVLGKEADLTKKKSELFRSYEGSKKERMKEAVKQTRGEESEAIRHARRKMYKGPDQFLRYLFERWDMAFETYQVLEFIFRASVESHDRSLFDYGVNHYADALEKLSGTPQEKYESILGLVQDFSKDSFFGLDDIRPTKMDFVRDLNAELYQHVELLKKVHREINKSAKTNPVFENLSKDLGKSMWDLEQWAYDRILGTEARGKFLSFHDGQVVMDHRNFIYFKVYILVFMGVYGEFTGRANPQQRRLYELASNKLGFESARHFDFDMNSTFLLGRERYAEQEREVESIAFERGFVDDALMDYIVEKNEELLEKAGELPFHLVRGSHGKRTA